MGTRLIIGTVGFGRAVLFLPRYHWGNTTLGRPHTLPCHFFRLSTPDVDDTVYFCFCYGAAISRQQCTKHHQLAIAIGRARTALSATTATNLRC